MEDFIEMTCKSCGGKLQITTEIDDFACMYCGTEFKVKRGGGIISLSPVVEELQKVSISTDKTASELAIVRLNQELEELNEQLIVAENEYKNKWTHERNKLRNELAEKLENRRNGYIALVSIGSIIILVILFSLLRVNTYLTIILSMLISSIIIYWVWYANVFDITGEEKLKNFRYGNPNQEVDYLNSINDIKRKIKRTEEELAQHKLVVSGM